MADNEGNAPAAPRFPGTIKRRAAAITLDDLVEIRPLYANGALPLFVEPRVPGLELAAWTLANRTLVEEHLLRHGGILFRGFAVDSPAQLEAFLQALAGGALEYRERSSPRSQVEGKIYTSTDYPPTHSIFLHNENSYQNVWPLKIAFFCQIPAAQGGATPIADCRRVFARMDPAVRDRFVDKGWMYVRNFGDGLGLDWKTVFQTQDRSVVEEYCNKSGITVEWRPDGRLRTRSVRPAVTPHPRTGELLWFNHATFFHVSTLEPDVRQVLLDQYDQDELPTNTYYGDGSPIEPATLDHLRSLYHQETLQFPWRRGDVLLLDNMMTAHGRAPFAGERKVLVGMAEPVTRK